MGVEEVAVAASLATLGVLIAAEHAAPARAFETVPGWRVKGMVFVVMVLALSAAVPFVLEDTLAPYRLLPGHRLGVVGGTVVGIVSSELLVYWAHRLHHRVPLLWRWIHQMHHSAERVDIWGAAYFHPLEIIEGAVLGLVYFNVVLGLPPEAAVIGGMWQGFAGMFQHANIRTPVWLGYLIQRPEAHALHHQRGVHDFNYANLSLWDIVFGTFRNPREWSGLAGFYSGASHETWQMLVGRDVSRPPASEPR